MNYFSPITDHVVSQDGFQAILDLADDGYYNNQTRSANFGQSPEAISRLDDTNPDAVANFYTYPEPPPFVEEDLPDADWSHHFAPTTSDVQDLQDEGVTPSCDEVAGNITSVVGTVNHDNLPQSLPPDSLHILNFSEPQAPRVTTALNELDSMPSPAPDIALSTPSSSDNERCNPSPPNNEGRDLDVRGRRYHCSNCGTSSNTKRDHERHLSTKKHQKKTGNGSGGSSGSGSASPVPGYHCLAPSCEYSRGGGKTFTREDNLWRHMKTAHHLKARA
ncbi:hypothetical protein B0T09DRAFT_252807 [Sordaria sp. MPI-SDFR-AT-0083]|nr:hypothetical protein B0T09DRAFT_252807 [Sordaria sp. MPI-SDFR-AT-0083]